MSDKERIAALEAVIRDVPAYIDNWAWAEEHYDVLKTVPGYEFPTSGLHIRWRIEQASQEVSHD